MVAPQKAVFVVAALQEVKLAVAAAALQEVKLAVAAAALQEVNLAVALQNRFHSVALQKALQLLAAQILAAVALVVVGHRSPLVGLTVYCCQVSGHQGLRQI